MTRAEREAAHQIFVGRWFAYRDREGLTIPLPWGWSVKVRGLTRLGITEDDWREIIPRAMGAHHVATPAVFAYAVGIAWGYLADRQLGSDDDAWPGLLLREDEP